jgi:hypothetical protein
MKIILEDNEFQKMASAWVHENFVEKILLNASVVENVIELDVAGEDEPKTVTFPSAIDTEEVEAAIAFGDGNGS